MNGTGLPGIGDRDAGGEEDQDGAGDNQHHVAQPRGDALADADRHQEVGDRDALLRGRNAGERRDRVGHGLPRASSAAGRRRAQSTARARPADQQARPTSGRAAGRGPTPPRTALTIDRRPAIRAGWAAASIASATPRTMARTIVGTGTPEPFVQAAGRRDDQQHADRDAGHRPDHGADGPQDPGLDQHAPPDLAPAHPDRAQHPELADALPDVHRQRVDDPERRRSPRRRGPGGRAARTRGPGPRRPRPPPAETGATVSARCRAISATATDASASRPGA